MVVVHLASPRPIFPEKADLVDAKTQSDESIRDDPEPKAKGRRRAASGSSREQPDSRLAEDSREQGSERSETRRGPLSYPKRHPRVTVGIVLVVLLAAAGALLWWLDARRYESTDDAFIDARTVTIGAEVAGRITDVAVTDNQIVKAGDVLLKVDDSDYQAGLAQAEAGVAAARANIGNVAAQANAQDAKVEQAEKQVEQARAALDFARAEDKRNQELLAKGTGTQQQAQQAASTLQQDQAALDSAQASVAAAKSQVAVLQAQAKSAEAKLQQAEASDQQARTTLSRTTIVAPVDGRATSISAAKGTYAQPGQVLMMFVPRDVWVKANFKETQLSLMRPGQPVDIEIDAYPERTFHGRVDSIQSGSGTAFSLLPAENATGNFVKVVQRVPVKIVFDQQPDILLGPGMSVVPTVKVR